MGRVSSQEPAWAATCHEENVNYTSESPTYNASGSLSHSSGLPPSDHSVDSIKVRVSAQRYESVARGPLEEGNQSKKGKAEKA